MKVIQVIDTLNIGGAETLVKDYLLHFPAGVERFVICLGERCGSFYETLLEREGIPVYYCGEGLKGKKLPPPVSYLIRLRRFQSLVNRIRPDVIHGHLTAVRYLAAANVGKARLFYTLHNELQVLAARTRGFDRCIRRCIRKKGMVPIALHHSMQAACNRRYQIQSTVYLQNGIELDRFAAADTAMDNPFRRQFDIPQEAVLLGSVGRLMPVKNHVFLVDILHQLRARGIDAHLAIAGKGPEQEAIQKRAEEMGVAGFLRLTGVQKDTPALYQSLDLFVMPSRWEGFPITLIEAQAAGVRCLISDVIDDETKILSTTWSCSLSRPAGEWADMAIRLLGQQPERDYREKMQPFDIKWITARLMELYQAP